MSSAALKKRHDLRTRDSALIRRNGALKNTRKLLDTASELLDRGNIRGCYSAIHDGILTFVGDSLDQPPGTVNSLSLNDILLAHNVGENLIERAAGIVGRCDLAEYSPGGLRTADHRQAIQDAGVLIEELKKSS